MKTKKKTKVNLNLSVVTKVQRKLLKSEQKRNELNKLYINEIIEQHKTERLLKIELERNAFYYECINFLHLALSEARNLNKEEIKEKIEQYKKFRQEIYQTFTGRIDKLNKIEISINGKYKILYADGRKEVSQAEAVQEQTKTNFKRIGL